MSSAVANMPKKRSDEQGSGSPKGRPKGSGRITLRYAIVTTPEYRAWMDSFMEYAGEIEVSDVIRQGIKLFAEQKGFRPPPKR